MADDREILREVWDGIIPVCFVLAEEEIFCKDRPDPFYVMVRRQTYFPLITERVQRHFTDHIDPDVTEKQLWLEDDGQPLKWKCADFYQIVGRHYPVGVLMDLSCAEKRLPWTITVHFQNFPSTELLAYNSREAIEAHFMSCIKEADFLKHRGQVMNSMRQNDHNQLWRGIVNERFEMFWGVNKKLMENIKEQPFRHIPFRIYQVDTSFIQVLITPTSEEGKEHTLLDLLTIAAPHALLTPGEAVSDHRVIIQGTEPPLDTSLLWLSLHLSHPDNFLHICLVPNS